MRVFFSKVCSKLWIKVDENPDEIGLAEPEKNL